MPSTSLKFRQMRRRPVPPASTNRPSRASPATIAMGAGLSAAGCLALLGIGQGTNYSAICAQLIVIGGGLGLLVPPLTSTLLGSVEKSRCGIAAGVLNATRQTGSVLGVALFGSLAGRTNAFLAGAHTSLMIAAGLLLAAGAAIWWGSPSRNPLGSAQREVRAAERHRRAETQSSEAREHA
jgi:hypothetical protein